MSLELIGKFIGPNEIVSTEVVDLKTPEGKDILLVTFKDGRTRVFPLRTLELVVTDETTDYNSVFEKKGLALLREVMALFAEYDLAYGEIELFSKQMITNLENNFNRAMSYMWYKNDIEFAPGTDPMWDVSLLMAHRVTSQIPQGESKIKENEPTE